MTREFSASLVSSLIKLPSREPLLEALMLMLGLMCILGLRKSTGGCADSLSLLTELRTPIEDPYLSPWIWLLLALVVDGPIAVALSRSDTPWSAPLRTR